MNIIEALGNFDVKITFKSLRSGKNITGVYTLKNQKVRQNTKSNKIVCLDIRTKRWEDIEQSTIVDWEVVSSAKGGRNE
jgi:hypothetical protein